jgi:hypothetical protein
MTMELLGPTPPSILLGRNLDDTNINATEQLDCFLDNIKLTLGGIDICIVQISS